MLWRKQHNILHGKYQARRQKIYQTWAKNAWTASHIKKSYHVHETVLIIYCRRLFTHYQKCNVAAS